MTGTAATTWDQVRREIEAARFDDPLRMARWYELLADRTGKSPHQALSEADVIAIWEETATAPSA